MKTKLILKTTGVLIVMISLLILTSCSRKAEGSLVKDQILQKDSNLTATIVDDKNFTESDEDLTSVNYKEFYDELSPHGDWIQVKPEEVGLQSKTTSLKSSGNKGFSLSNLLGVKDAYASTEVDLGMIFVWQPSQDLTINVVEGEQRDYRPYRHGRWVYTDEGWYFRAPTPWEETIHHHGRWVYSPTAGWLWIPGRVWAPAWVNWRQNDDYVSWAPLPPSDYLVDGNMDNSQIDDDYYVIVERRHFIDPDIYQYDDRYHPRYYDNGDRIMVGDMSGTPGITVINNIIINKGPDVNIIQNVYGRHIDEVNLQHVTNYNDANYSNTQYKVYTPEFTRYTSKENTRFTVNEPKSFKNYNEVRKVDNTNDIGKTQKSNENGYVPNNTRVTTAPNNNTKVTTAPNNNTKVTIPKNNTKVTVPRNDTKVTVPKNDTKVTVPKKDAKVTVPKNDTKVTVPKNDTKVTVPKNDTKVTEPKNNTKAKDPKNDTKITDPKNDTKITEPKNNTKVTEPKNDTKITEPKNNTKVTEPKNNTKVTEPKKDTKVTDPKNDTKTKDPKNDTKGNAPDENNKSNKSDGNNNANPPDENVDGKK